MEMEMRRPNLDSCVLLSWDFFVIGLCCPMDRCLRKRELDIHARVFVWSSKSGPGKSSTLTQSRAS